MREMKLPDSGPKRKLFDAATRLFAERGFDLVSVREICAAGGANIAAVNYHFGSRDELVAWVMTSHLAPVLEARAARLDSLEKAGGKGVALEAILEALVQPIVLSAQQSELHDLLFFKLIGMIFQQNPENLPSELRAQLALNTERFKRAFASIVPSLSADELAWRLQFTLGALSDLLVRVDGAQAESAGSMDRVLERFVRYAAAGMRGGVAAEVGEFA